MFVDGVKIKKDFKAQGKYWAQIASVCTRPCVTIDWPDISFICKALQVHDLTSI